MSINFYTDNWNWLPLYDISWFDAKLEFLEIKENEITLMAEWGIFVEVLNEDSKLVLNILTDPNEYSFTAEDVSITIDETEKI